MTLRFTYLIVLLMGLFQTQNLSAQKLTASAPSQVQVGQRFRVTWELNAGGSDFVAPEITDFRVLSGPNQSTSMQYINGSMSQSISFSYVLESIKEGNFNIGSAKIKANGNIVSSNELTINVVKGATSTNSGASPAANNQSSSSSTTANSNDLFARVEVSKRTAYLGEKITADLKIYSRVSIVNFDDWKMPSFEGFWTTSG